MTQTTSSLVTAIRAKCQRAGWYGGWDFRPRRISEARINAAPTSTFTFPAANELQIVQTETSIGFTLPPFLRTLLGELANGGFGPGGGLRGVVGGYGTVGTQLPNGERARNDETIGKYHVAGGTHLVDMTAYQWQSRRILLPYDVWPKQFIPLCDLGDQVEVCIDQSGRVFYWGPSSSEGMFQFSDRAISLEQWIEMWIQS